MGLLGNVLLIAVQASLAVSHGARSPVAFTEANVAASAFAVLAAPAVGLVTATGLGWRIALLPAITWLTLLVLCFRRTRFENGCLQRHAGVSYSRSVVPLPPRYWAFWCLLTVETGAEWCLAYWGASFLASRGPFSVSTAATAMSAFFLAMLAGRYAGSRFSRILPALRLLGAALCVAVIGLPLLWLAPSPALRIAGLFVVGLGLANVHPLGIALAVGTAPGQADRAAARLTVGSGMSVLIAPVVLGALADAVGIHNAFGITIPLLLSAVLALFTASRLPPIASAPSIPPAAW